MDGYDMKAHVMLRQNTKKSACFAQKHTFSYINSVSLTFPSIIYIGRREVSCNGG